MAETLPTANGDVLAAVITAGKSFLLLAKLHNGSSLPLDLKQFTLDVPQGWKSELFMDQVPKTHRSGRWLRADFPGDAARGCAAHEGLFPSR